MHVVDLEMIDLVVLQKFIVIVSLSFQALGIDLYIFSQRRNIQIALASQLAGLSDIRY